VCVRIVVLTMATVGQVVVIVVGSDGRCADRSNEEDRDVCCVRTSAGRLSRIRVYVHPCVRSFVPIRASNESLAFFLAPSSISLLQGSRKDVSGAARISDAASLLFSYEYCPAGLVFSLRSTFPSHAVSVSTTQAGTHVNTNTLWCLL